MFGVLAVVGFAFITHWSLYSPLHTSTQVFPEYIAISRPVPLRGTPTERFRDNLLDETKDITTWLYAGWTNSVMIQINLIYLALLTDRIPILSKFVPTTQTPGAEFLLFSEVFDLPRLRDALNMHILGTSVESIGCWSTRKAQFNREPVPTSHSRLYQWTKKFTYPSSYLSDIARFAYPETRNENLGDRVLSSLNVSLPPDEHLLCFDELYFLCTAVPDDEFDWDYNPQWKLVGQHMHWAPQLSQLAYVHLNRAFGLRGTDPTPPYIAIHARRGDIDVCSDKTACFSSITVISRRVEEVRQGLLETRGIEILSRHILMTSDETDPKWWDEILETHGAWYPVFVDAVIQSGGVGFIGTHGSTMSSLARRRAQSWHNAVTVIFKWGNPTADDH
ncbi:hypothetical protein BDZ89DRAFT_1075312 [Hymenopellis radicata]|nr:hypothetical protein BDZ89DRAFT_1075312 [Hymenopellis radicata]